MIKVMRLELIGRQFDNQYSLDFQDYVRRIFGDTILTKITKTILDR